MARYLQWFSRFGAALCSSPLVCEGCTIYLLFVAVARAWGGGGGKAEGRSANARLLGLDTLRLTLKRSPEGTLFLLQLCRPILLTRMNCLTNHKCGGK